MSVKADSEVSSSILSEAAKHELELLGRLDSSRQEAKSVVEESRLEARRKQQEAEQSLNQEVLEIRRAAEAKRHAAFQTRIQEAEAQLTGAREASAGRVSEMTRAVLSLFVPRGGGAK